MEMVEGSFSGVNGYLCLSRSIECSARVGFGWVVFRRCSFLFYPGAVHNKFKELCGPVREWKNL